MYKQHFDFFNILNNLNVNLNFLMRIIIFVIIVYQMEDLMYVN